MEYTDTEKLLRECNSGTKMAVSSIDEVEDHIRNSELKELLQESRAHHQKLELEIRQLLGNHDTSTKEPSAMAKGMSWMKTSMKLEMEDSDRTVADLITDGCNMGVKSLHRYQNQYKRADEKSKEICSRLISIEEELCQKLQRYL